LRHIDRVALKGSEIPMGTQFKFIINRFIHIRLGFSEFTRSQFNSECTQKSKVDSVLRKKETGEVIQKDDDEVFAESALYLPT
jgi:hypothetical protein